MAELNTSQGTRSRQINVLCLTSRYPVPSRSGADVRVSWLLRCVRALPEATVTLAAVAAERDTPPGSLPKGISYCIERPDAQPASVALRWARAVARRTPVWMLARRSAVLERRLASADADVVVVLDDAAAGMLDYVPHSIPVVLDKHNVLTWLTTTAAPAGGTDVLQRVRDGVHRWVTRRYERRVLARSNAVTVTSPEDVDRLRTTFGARATGVVPSSSPRSATPWIGGPHVGVLGAMAVRPNLDGLVRLLEDGGGDLADLGITLSVAGQLPRDGLPCDVPGNVEILGFVDDLDSWLSSLAALVVPLWWGSGVKTKTITAMAAGVPVVSTPEGVEGLAVDDGVHCVIRTTPAALLAAAAQLRADPDRARAIGRDGQRLVSEAYSVDRSAQVLRAAIDEALAGSSPMVDGARPRRAGPTVSTGPLT